LLWGGVVCLGWSLLPTTTPAAVKTTSIVNDVVKDLSKTCLPELEGAECNPLTSNPEIASLLKQQNSEPKQAEANYSWIEFYQIPIAILVALMAIGWIFISFIGSAIDNYRVGWRAPVIRQVIDFIDPDRILTYIGRAESQDLRQALLHSGMISNDSEDLIYIAVEDSIAIKWQNTRISWSDVRATIPTGSILSILDRFFQVLHHKSGLYRFFKLNLFSLTIKSVRAIVYLIKYLINRRFAIDDFTREIVGNEAGRQTIFTGMFCQILLPETYDPGQMLVIPQPTKHHRTEANIPNHLEKIVKVADAEFERIFSIYSTDRITPSKILSPTIERYAIDYYRDRRQPIYISTNDRILYLGIATPSPFLEPKLGRNPIDFAPLRDYYHAVKFMLDIAAAL
jgi:hypothetical protein